MDSVAGHLLRLKENGEVSARVSTCSCHHKVSRRHAWRCSCHLYHYSQCHAEAALATEGPLAGGDSQSLGLNHISSWHFLT